jgi:hypothetical protein
MPDQMNQSTARSRDFLDSIQQELDRFEQYEKKLLADDRKEREQRLVARFATNGLDFSFK